MPHLSPMNWIFYMLMLWTLLLMITSSNWWSQSNSFKTSPLSHKTDKNMMSPWKWL